MRQREIHRYLAGTRTVLVILNEPTTDDFFDAALQCLGEIFPGTVRHNDGDPRSLRYLAPRCGKKLQQQKLNPSDLLVIKHGVGCLSS